MTHSDWQATHHGTTTTQRYIGEGEQTVPEKCKSVEAQVCRKCGAAMAPGIALEQTYTDGPDDLGDEIVTMSPGGSGQVVSCRKCTECGWSVTGAAPQEAKPVAWRRMNHSGTQSTGVTDTEYYADLWRKEGSDVRPLYAHPAPAPAAPVEGIDALREEFRTDSGCYDITAMLRTIAALRAQQPAPEVKALTLGDLRPIWRKHGGDWHGPHVEMWIIPEKNMVAVVSAFLSALSGEAQG